MFVAEERLLIFVKGIHQMKELFELMLKGFIRLIKITAKTVVVFGGILLLIFLINLFPTFFGFFIPIVAFLAICLLLGTMDDD